MTANVDIALAGCGSFQALSMGETVEETDHLLVAPHCLQNKVIHMIDREIEHDKSWRTSLYWIKNELLNRQKRSWRSDQSIKAGVN